jgi:hypothetical protein
VVSYDEDSDEEIDLRENQDDEDNDENEEERDYNDDVRRKDIDRLAQTIHFQVNINNENSDLRVQ